MDGVKDGENLVFNKEFIQLIILIQLAYGGLINKITKVKAIQAMAVIQCIYLGNYLIIFIYFIQEIHIYKN